MHSADTRQHKKKLKQFGFNRECVVDIRQIPNLDFVNTMLAPARIRQRRSTVATERDIGRMEAIPMNNSVDESSTGCVDMEIDNSVPVHVHMDDNSRRSQRNLDLFNNILSNFQFHNYHRSTRSNATFASALHTIPEENPEAPFE